MERFDEKREALFLSASRPFDSDRLSYFFFVNVIVFVTD
jgi:hypothetical protein